MNPQRVLRGFKPLLCLPDGLLLARGYALYRCGYDLASPRLVARLPVPMAWRAKAAVRMAARATRAGIQLAAPLDNDTLLLVTRSLIWRLHLKDGKAAVEFEIPHGRRLLNLTPMPMADSGQQLAFGEYFDNPTMAGVKIWRRSAAGHWDAAFEFAAGQINHVHNICPGRSADEWWVLTGDFNGAAALWLTDAGFRQPTALLQGDQAYRATWLAASANGAMVHATDTQMQTNHLRRIEVDAETGQARSTVIAPIEGSSIYFAHAHGRTYFSSTVEPDAPSGHFLRDMLSRKRGPGILSDDAVIYEWHHHLGQLREVFRAPKDWMPSRLGQFGTFMFPAGKPPDGLLVMYGLAVKALDDTTIVFNV